MRHKYIYLLVLGFTLLPRWVSAAEFLVDTKASVLMLGQPFEAAVYLNSEGMDINAFEGVLEFPADKMEVKEIREGNTVANFWIEKPKADGGRIKYSGITPGGYNGERGFLFSVVFLPKVEGRAELKLHGLSALINDGLGTAAAARARNANVEFSLAAPAMPVAPLNDRKQPEPFEFKLISDPDLYGGKILLVFSTKDKDSGIDKFEIKETRYQALINQVAWKTAESPYVLADQELKSYVVIRAVDKAGNERVTTIEPKVALPWYSNAIIWAILTASLSVVGVGIVLLWRNFKR
ncbi:MAG: hypothetical protein PHW63_08300 [Alphaproteobacteria bacterium]|nr:hypothetical protein [Alphaproteobacteria bacterium]